MSLVIHETLISTLISADNAMPRGFLHGLIVEDLLLAELSAVSGDVWEAWVFNGPTFEPSVYSGFSFNSYTVYEGLTYAAREEGIYILDGTTDAGAAIHDGVILSPSTFGTNNRKRFRVGVFDVEGLAPIVRAEVGSVGSSIPILHSKAFFPRSLMGMKWTFLIAEFDELGQLELFPVILTR